MENNEKNEPIVSVTAAQVRDAYNVAEDNDDLQKVLIALFGLDVCTGEEEEEEDNRPVTERIKTFSDAYDELSPNNPLIMEYDKVYLICEGVNEYRNLLAFMKLRIIAAALNGEEWELPSVDSEDYVYYPLFVFYSKEEWDMLSDERKRGGLLLGGYAYSGAAAGLVYSNSFSVPSCSGPYFGSRLCFKTEKLATYAGRQFIELYADYYLG
jgi:hypothetical protein